MRLANQSFILGLLLLCFFHTEGFAQPDASFDRQKMISYLQKLVHNQKVMGSIAIDSAGKEVFNFSMGAKRLSPDSIKADDQTRYRIGSVTKTFTATMIFQLIEKDKLSLTTKLSTFYPRLPQADSITVEHLLRHQSGLFNYINTSDYTDWMTQPHSQEQLLDTFSDQESEFTPGSQTKYSNTNYVLLGFIIEDLTGHSYASELQERIAKPLGLSHTYYGDAIDSKNEAASFRFTDSA